MLFSMLAVPCLKCTLCRTAFGLNCEMHGTGGTRPKNSYPLFDMTLVFSEAHSTGRTGPKNSCPLFDIILVVLTFWSFLWNRQNRSGSMQPYAARKSKSRSSWVARGRGPTNGTDHQTESKSQPLPHVCLNNSWACPGFDYTGQCHHHNAWGFLKIMGLVPDYKIRSGKFLCIRCMK